MYLLRDPGFAVPYLVWTVSGIFRSDILLTVSQSSALDIARTFHKNPIVISSMISLPNHTFDSRPLPHDLSHSDYLIYTGGMDARKNVHKLLEAFARSLPRHPDLRLVIIGRNTEHLAPLISDLDVASRVILTGFISEEEKSALLEGARALVYPSMYEGFGLPILEAFGADVPVLTCRNSSLFEVAGDAALYVDPDSAASIADGITTILQRDVADKLRTLGRAQLAKYDPLIARQKLVDVFTMRRPI
jgi:glycosyltransferase involved in cell wall biosynthesis